MHRFQILLLIVVSFFAISCDQTGTTTTFTGTVVDVLNKQPLPGVVVSVMPFNLGQETDQDGTFSIALPRTDESVYLVFSKPGYDKQETLKMPLSPRKKNVYTFTILLIRRVAIAELSEELIDFGGSKTEIVAQLSNPGNDTLFWSFLDIYFPPWLQVEPLSGELPPEQTEELLFTCDRSLVEIGHYLEEIQLTGAEAPLFIPVALLKEGALLEVEGTYFEFGEEETAVVTTLKNKGNIPFDWQLEDALPEWLSWEQTEGTIQPDTEQSIAITADRSVLDYGSYTYHTKLLSKGGDVSYVFQIDKTQDVLQVSPKTLDFGMQSVQRTFSVSRLAGVHPVTFTLTCEDENLSFIPTQGTISKEQESIEVVVTLDREHIPAGASASIISVAYAEEELKVAVNYATEAGPPEVASDGVALDKGYRLHFKGTLVTNGGGAIIQHGHCWSTEPDPEVSVGNQGGCTQLGSLEDGSTFVSYPETLPADGTTWYVRAYAENEVALAYGQTFVFTYEPPSLRGLQLNDDEEENELTLYERRAAGTPFLERGFAWSFEEKTPVLEEDHHVLLGGHDYATQFSYILTKPERGVTYRVRSFAVNASGIAYSNTLTSFLPIVEPVLVTGAAEHVTHYAATLQGTLEKKGSEEILSYGHCWSSEHNQPTWEDDHTNLGANPPTGSFVSSLEHLLINTTYYYRSYVRTTKGVHYGPVQEFTTQKDNSVVVSDGLKMFFTVNQEGKAFDWTGAAHDLIVSNGIRYKTAIGQKPKGVPAAISFNGNSGYLYSKNKNPLSGISRGTISFWLRFPDGMRQDEMYPFIGSASEDGMFFMISHDKKDWVLSLSMGPGKETYSEALPSVAGLDITNFLGKEWHMLTVVSNGQTMMLYLDGVKMPIDDMAIPMAFGVQDDLVVGAHALGGSTLNTFLKGDMAALRFYDRMLSDSEVASIYNAEQ